MGGLAGLANTPRSINPLFAENGQRAETDGIVGMYVHQHWPYNHPYAARTWTVEDYRGYAEGLTQPRYNTMLI